MGTFMKFFMIALFQLAIAAFLVVLGNRFVKSGSVSQTSREMPGGILGARLRIISALFGENAGTAWIKLMGYLCYLLALALVGVAIYLIIAQPAHLIKA